MEDIKNKSILIIVESPNKCKTISEALKKAGYNKVIVKASVGHISGLMDDKKSYKNSGVYVDKDFDLNIKVSDDKFKVVKELKELADNADLVYLMSDPDREGECISWSLIKFLKLPKAKYRRAVTHEITPKAIVHAIENPIQLNADLVDAGQSRMALDKMVGYSLSPIAKNYVGCRSVGRCQSAGLKLIVDREKEIRDFKPESYFDLFLHFKKNSTAFKAKYLGYKDKKVDRITSKEDLEDIIAACTKKYTVESIVSREKQESPKPPFCTSTYQQEVASKLGLSIEAAMDVAQKLFEGVNVGGEHIGLITYHRTDDQEFSPEFIPILKDYIEKTYGKVFNKPKVGKKAENAQEGHEALRVVNPELTPEKAAQYIQNELYLKVYKLIWQRTVASALPNATFEETTFIINNNDQKFKMTYQHLTKAGFKQVYNYKDDGDADDEIITEAFVEGEILEHCELKTEAKSTKPPARYKEATFIKKLEALGIGRPSTYATIIKTVLSPSRGYCNLEDKCMVPTEKGIELINFLDRSFSNVINLNYTKELEEKLDSIAGGKLTKTKFLTEFYNELEKTINSNTEIKNNALLGQEVTAKCPKCGAPMKVRRSKFGSLFLGCSRYPSCNGILKMNENK